ncbi:MAG: methyltetrahydrofolate cobalamin methyltransferase [Armatimonadetes bacterium]|nr:methyltetrahydrofolate cobalamin methyltransferase [Armatimonadota bacterium]
MLIIGERINSTRKAVGEAVKARDTGFIRQEAIAQAEAGAHFLDCNGAVVGVEAEPGALVWLVQTCQEATGVPCAIDTPNAQAMEAALKAHQGQAFINSITAEKAKFDRILPLARDYKAKVVALCLDDSGIPQTLEARIRNADFLVKGLTAGGVAADDIYLDPLVFPVSTSGEAGLHVLETIRHIHAAYPGVHTVCGLSNISYGLPARKLLNRAFLVLCIGAGLDGVIADPLDQPLMALVRAGEVLLARDEFCAEYIAAARQGKLE